MNSIPSHIPSTASSFERRSTSSDHTEQTIYDFVNPGKVRMLLKKV
ncbi:MAG TPA: hypothetical protein VKV20_10625 [Ktedonobacteraceae bacterium]|nr:hypothetical protein [Ktedonobacteraceae bacterium]